MAASRARVSVEFPPSLRQRVELTAAAERRSLSNAVCVLVEAGLALREGDPTSEPVHVQPSLYDALNEAGC